MKERIKTNPEAKFIYVVAKKCGSTVHWTTAWIDNNQQYGTKTRRTTCEK